MSLDYELMSSVESWGSTSYGVKILVARPKEALERLRAVHGKGYSQQSEEERDALYKVPDATVILESVKLQDRMLDPAIKSGERNVRKIFLKCFQEANLPAAFIETIPSGYFRDTDAMAVGNSWYRVTTRIGVFIVGWRKSVISIDWKHTILKTSEVGRNKPPDGVELFPLENVTRFDTGMHAWGYEKLTAYLKFIGEWPHLTEKWWE